ncbi:MAG: DUF4175 family protein [Pseudomonadota bacterium]
MSSNAFNLFWLKFLSTCSLLFERLGMAFWRLACWGMFFAALWLFEILTPFGQWVGALALFVAVLGAVHFIRKDVLAFRWPSRTEVARRIEQESSVSHRPLSGIDDSPIDDENRALWTREKLRKLRLLSMLKAARPQNFVALKDPRALRFALFLAVICGLIIAGDDWKPRITKGFTPIVFNAPSEAGFEATASLWISPPEYTKAERIVPEAGSEDILQVPQGSILKAIVQKNWLHILRKPSINIDDMAYEMQDADGGSYAIELEIPEGERITLNAGLFKNNSWSYTFTPDNAPQLAVSEDVEVLSDGKLQFAVNMIDDYGVQHLNMRMMLDPSVEAAPQGWAVHEERSVLSPPGREFQMSPVYDLAAHPWAGLPVIFTFIAHDHLDQIAQSPPVRMALPERRFINPVAQRVIQIRKKLAWEPEAPYRDAATALINVLSFPHEYGHNKRIFLALRAATSRMFYNEPSVEISQSIMSLLWDTALQLEDGDLSLAARALRNAQMDLERALNDPNTSDAELSFLMNKLREAMGEYMQAMAREFQKRAAEGRQMPQLPPEMLNTMLSGEDLARMMDKMMAEVMSGDRSAAQDMLSKLQRLLDMTGPSMEPQLPPDMQMMAEGMNTLRELIDAQEALKELTQEQAEMFQVLTGLGVNDEMDEPPPFINTASHQEEQERLRQQLEDLIEKAQMALQDVPESFGLAALAMGDSAQYLEGNRPDLSIPAQDEALEHLKDSQQQMMQQMAQRMQQMTGLSLGGRAPMRYDPLGRPYGGEDGNEGAPFGSRVKVPTDSERKRVQEILNELRRRASERNRPQEELDYYRRLLRRF